MPALANIYCHDVPSGLTLTGELYPDGSDTAAGTGLTVTEATNRKGTYILNADKTGLHRIILKSGANIVWGGWTPTNLAITGDFEACATRREALNLDAKVSDVYADTQRVDALIEDSGGDRFTEKALEEAPAGGGGGDCPTVDEIVDALSGRTIVIQSPLDGAKVTLYAEAKYESGTQRLVVTNSTGAGWPNGATWDAVKFVARTGGVETAYGTGAWIVTSGAGAQVAITFTAAEMAALQAASDENDVCAVWAYKTSDPTSRFPLLAQGKLKIVDVPWA